MKRVRTYWNFIKPLVRTTVDTHILPGIITGTEISWIYVMQWKKECYTIALTILALVSYQLDAPADTSMYSSQSVVENENMALNQNQ